MSKMLCVPVIPTQFYSSERQKQVIATNHRDFRFEAIPNILIISGLCADSPKIIDFKSDRSYPIVFWFFPHDVLLYYFFLFCFDKRLLYMVMCCLYRCSCFRSIIAQNYIFSGPWYTHRLNRASGSGHYWRHFEMVMQDSYHRYWQLHSMRMRHCTE